MLIGVVAKPFKQEINLALLLFHSVFIVENQIFILVLYFTSNAKFALTKFVNSMSIIQNNVIAV